MQIGEGAGGLRRDCEALAPAGKGGARLFDTFGAGAANK